MGKNQHFYHQSKYNLAQMIAQTSGGAVTLNSSYITSFRQPFPVMRFFLFPLLSASHNEELIRNSHAFHCVEMEN